MGELIRKIMFCETAPHTVKVLTANEWNHRYDRQKAAFPRKWVVENKFWPSVGRIDDGYRRQEPGLHLRSDRFVQV